MQEFEKALEGRGLLKVGLLILFLRSLGKAEMIN